MSDEPSIPPEERQSPRIGGPSAAHQPPLQMESVKRRGSEDVIRSNTSKFACWMCDDGVDYSVGMWGGGILESPCNGEDVEVDGLCFSNVVVLVPNKVLLPPYEEGYQEIKVKEEKFRIAPTGVFAGTWMGMDRRKVSWLGGVYTRVSVQVLW